MIRSLAIIAACIFLAVLSASATLALIYERAAPEKAIALPAPSGFAKAEAAFKILAEHQGQAPITQISLPADAQKQVIALSRAAYRSEPLSSAALRNLGMAAMSKGDEQRALHLMKDSSAISRRDITTETWLFAYYATRNDLGHALSNLDRALRTSEKARDLMVPVMVKSLASPDAVKPFEKLLKQAPPWSASFWAEAYKFKPALTNVAKIKVGLLKAGIRSDERYDQYLLSALVQNEHFAEADSLYDALEGQGSASHAIVRNGDFDRNVIWEPYDWQLYYDSSLTATLNARKRWLRVDTYGDGSGRAARTLVALPSGEFTFHAKALDWDESDRNAIYFLLQCAERGNGIPPASRIPLATPEISVTLRNDRKRCTYYWLEIVARPQPRQRENSVVLTNVQIEPKNDGA